MHAWRRRGKGEMGDNGGRDVRGVGVVGEGCAVLGEVIIEVRVSAWWCGVCARVYVRVGWNRFMYITVMDGEDRVRWGYCVLA